MSKQARINVSGASCTGRMVWRVLIYVCVRAYYVEGSRQTEEVKCLSINFFFLLYAPEFTAIKINLCESGLSLQDLVTFACLHIKFNNPVCESNHSHNSRSNLGRHLSGFGQERLNWAAGFQLSVGAAGWRLPGRFLCPGVSQSPARTG